MHFKTIKDKVLINLNTVFIAFVHPTMLGYAATARGGRGNTGTGRLAGEGDLC